MENKWEKYSNSFEKNNESVIGKAIIADIKSKLSLLKNTGDVLELGCGNGTYTDCLSSEATSVVATDLSEDMVATTRARYEGSTDIQVETADCSDLHYSDHSFDTVVMINLFHIIPDRIETLREAKRVLRQGGQVIIISITQHQMPLLHLIPLMFRYVRTYGSKPKHAIKLTPTVINSFAKRVGFTGIETMLLGDQVKALYAQIS